MIENAMDYAITLLVGVNTGWVAHLFVKGFSLSLLLKIGVGIMGAFAGRWVFGYAPEEAVSIEGRLLTAFIGACLGLSIAAFVNRQKPTV
jgi:uncharacterized membrane protein YeaQ/YmgE (transglycosylase-associated protein family)